MRDEIGVDRPTALDLAPAPDGRPILLVTHDVPLVEEAGRFAVETAVQEARPLLVVNVIGGRYYPMPGVPLPTAVVREDVERSLAEPARLAAALAVRTERLRILTPRPVEALVELVRERNGALVVLGSDPAQASRRLLRKATKALHERTSALVWP